MAGSVLPPELIMLIIPFLANPDSHYGLAPYATVSREWQAMVESRTFAYLELTTAKRLEEFKEIVAQNRR